MNIILSISQSAVLKEVAQTTNYTGSKMDDDANAYERITTVDEDQSELQRFWDESRTEVAQAFIRMLVSEGMAEDGDTVRIERWHHIANVSKMIVTDTVRDTVPVVTQVKVTEVREVNRVRWWQSALMWCGGIALLVAGGIVGFALWRVRH